MKKEVGAGRRTQKARKRRLSAASAPLPPKLTAPRPASIFPRKRLFHLLDSIREDHPVIWISAPAGSGKTSLAASYLQERRLPVLWYQVDSGDGDIASFFYYMGIAAKKAAPHYKKPLPVLTPEYLGDVPTFTRNFFRELYNRVSKSQSIKVSKRSDTLTHGHSDTNRRFLIVLDNYQDAPENSQLHDILHIAMAEAPEGINLLVLSRVEPPSVLARLRLCEHAACLDWEKMRLTAEETEGISALRMGKESPDSKALTALHESVQGWAAGVVLMLEQSRGGAPLAAKPTSTDQKLLFDYFAGEVLNRCEPKVQEFLLKTALFPKFTAKAAEALICIAESQTILDDLTQHNYFTVRHASEHRYTYEYHPLFREFLLNEAVSRYRADTLRVLQERAAGLLGDSGQVEAAADLLARIGAVQALVALILKHASTQLAQGRWQTLGQWLAAVPADLVETDPWLLYWRASATFPRDLFAAREDYRRAYLLFKERHEAIGAYLAWSAAVDSFMYLWSNFAPLDYWIDEMEALHERFPAYPSVEIEAQVTGGMVGASLWRRADTPIVRKWAAAAVALLDKPADVNTKISMGNNALLYYLWWQGNLSMSQIVYSNLKTLRGNPRTSPLALISWKVTEAAYLYLNGKADEAIAAAHQGLDLAAESGIHHMDLLLYAAAAYGQLTRFDADSALQELRRMESLLSDAETFDFAHYHYLMAWTLLCQNQPSAALEHIRIGEKAVSQIGASNYPSFVAMTKAQALYECGRAAEAFVVMEPAREWGQRVGNIYVEVQYRFMRSLHALDRVDAAECAAHLAAALRMCRAHAFPVIPWLGWRKPLLTRLLQQALVLGIEPDYVRAVIRGRNLSPAEDVPVPDLWPYPIKLYALGRFSLLVDDKPVKFFGKGQKKPIELLKELIAFGGRDVLEGQITDILWPEADGDAGHSAFTTTMQRLRKLLGNEDAILIKQGKITINPQYCYVDTWAFERLIKRADELWKENKESEALEIAEKAAALYKGRFLGKEGEKQGMFSMQERLRSKFIRTLARIGLYYEGKGEWKKAVECCQKGIEVDNLCEEFYQSLMLCYQHLGLKAEAITAYNRCHNAMTALINTEPSAKTKEIYQRIVN